MEIEDQVMFDQQFYQRRDQRREQRALAQDRARGPLLPGWEARFDSLRNEVYWFKRVPNGPNVIILPRNGRRPGIEPLPPPPASSMAAGSKQRRSTRKRSKQKRSTRKRV